jgi:hypothetical protein
VQGEFGVVLNAPKDTFAKADFSGLDAAHARDMRYASERQREIPLVRETISS